jgi:AcrR family transcriptional regulator
MSTAAAERAAPRLATDNSTAEALLDAAAALMMERDTIAVTLNDIAKKSGLNSALIKYYFGNKTGMLLALVRRVVAGSLSDLRDVVAKPVGPAVKLRMHIKGVVNSHHRHPYLHRLLHYLLSQNDEAVATALDTELIGPVVTAQKTILDEGVALGLFRSIDPTMFYFHLLGACESLFYSRALLKRAFGIDGIDRDFKNTYVTYLCDAIMRDVLAVTGGPD